MSKAAPSEETQAILRRQWFSSVCEISDFELQHRTWNDPTNQNPHWSYVEFCCQYPGEDQLQDGGHWGYLSAKEVEILSELGRAIIAHEPPGGNAYDTVAILGDEAWHSVVRLAERTRRKLLKSIEDPLERQILLGEATE